MASRKSLFAPLPLRAMAHDLSGLQLRVLACVAAHDRLSLVTGKGQGCWAKNERMRTMVGCSYARVCSTLSELTDVGEGALPGGPYLRREKVGKKTAYRVIYNEADRLLFSNTSDRPKGRQSANKTSPTCCEATIGSGTNLPETTVQYIPLSGGIDFEETRKENSTEVARFLAQPTVRVERAITVGARLAMLERVISDDPHSIDINAELEWLDCIRFDQTANPADRGRATRLHGDLTDLDEALTDWYALVGSM